VTLLEGWSVAPLQEFADVKLGKMLSPKAHEAGLVRLRYLRNENVQWGFVDLDDLKEMGFKPEELNRYTVEPGDLLVCEGGEPGRAAVYSGPTPMAYQKALHRVRPRCKGVSTALLRYWLEYLAGAGLLVEKIAQTTIQHLPLARFQTISLPLPPAAEQRRIVATIEEQLSRVEAGVQALKRVKKELVRYRASVLKAACEGQLVPTEAALARAEGRSYETASELLGRILAERRTRWDRKKKYADPAGPDTPSLPALPKGWAWVSVAQITASLEYGSSSRTTKDSAGVPVLRMGNIQDGSLDLRELKYLPRSHREFPKLLLKSGDLLFNRTNSAELVGKSAVYSGTPGVCSFASYLIRGRFREGSTSRFVAFFLNSPHGRRWVASVVTQQVGQANVSGSKLAALAIPLPPLAEQHRIVAEVERRLSIADGVAATVEAALARAKRLRQSILKRAFEGRLVPQDPNDEPASALLDRIRSERAATAAGKPAPRRRSVTASDTSARNPSGRSRRRAR